MRRFMCAAVLGAPLLFPTTAWCAGPLQRYAIVIGANFGGSGRPQLQYAISDAEHFARVMVDLGGVAQADEIILRQPKLHDLTNALDLLKKRVGDARAKVGATGGRTEVVFYYSGHADEQGLLIGDDRYSYRTLRDRLDEIPEDVRIAVLDACASGAFTRVKGGRARPPFMVDESADMRGHAFLTSSSETEAAQESDRIHASYFTHYLISGFRGAADLSGDGKVTLNEAYQFAFNETLKRTVDTKGGAQHPSYEINMSGTGDVVMTDMHQTTAILVLGEELEGRFFVRTSAQELVVELYKPRGRNVELAVEPGDYEVRMERDKGSFVAKATVGDGARVTVDPRQFGVTTTEPTQRRGEGAPLRFAVKGRNRFELLTGLWQVGNGDATATTTVTGRTAFDALGGLAYTRYVRDDLAVTLTVEGFGIQSGASVESAGVGVGTVVGFATLLGVRWNPIKGDHRQQPLKPFISIGAGPVTGMSSGSFVSQAGVVSTGLNSQSSLGGHFGGGLDVHVTRSFSIGLDIGYNAMLNFSQPVGLRDNFNGAQVSLGLGWLFGKGDAR